LAESEKKRATLTLQELEVLRPETNNYRALGKGFVSASLVVLKKEQQDKIVECDTALKALQAKKQYIERELEDVSASFKELAQSSPMVMQQLAQGGL